MKADATSIALSGIKADETRLKGASHNLANLLTEDFHPLRTEQEDVAEGGTRATQKRASEPEDVSIAEQIVEQTRASIQVEASVRALNTALGTLGSVLDIKS